MPEQNGNSGNYWQNGLLLLVISIPFVTFKYDYLSKDWLNRLGIILNFLAGFMVAPDLIGVNRLVSLEEYLELRLEKIQETFSSLASSVVDSPRFLDTKLFVLVSRLTVYLIPIVLFHDNKYFINGFTIYLLILFVLAVYGTIRRARYLFASRDRRLKLQAKRLASLNDNDRVKKIEEALKVNEDSIIKIVWKLVDHFIDTYFAIVLYFPFTFLFILLFTPFEYLLDIVINSLKGDKRIVSILVWWGVIFFIMGNFMQFVASFDYTKPPLPSVIKVAPKTPPSSFTTTD